MTLITEIQKKDDDILVKAKYDLNIYRKAEMRFEEFIDEH